MRPNHMPPKLCDRWTSRAARSSSAPCSAPSGSTIIVQWSQAALKLDEPVRAGEVEQPLVVGVEGLGGAGGAGAEQRGDVRPVDVAGGPRLLDGGEGAQRPGVAQPLAGHLDRHPLLPRQPRRAGLGPRGAASTAAHPSATAPGLGRVEPAPQPLHREHRVRERVVGQPVEVDVAQLGQHRGGPVEHVGQRCAIASSSGPGAACDVAAHSLTVAGTVTSVPRGNTSTLSNTRSSVNPRRGSLSLAGSAPGDARRSVPDERSPDSSAAALSPAARAASSPGRCAGTRSRRRAGRPGSTRCPS